MKLKALFLDDMKERHRIFHGDFGSQFEVTHAYSYDQFIGEMLNDDFDILFLDHDLSGAAINCDPDNIDERTGTDVAKWLVKHFEFASNNKRPGVVVHSLNPIGRTRMVCLLNEGGIEAVPMPFYNLISLTFTSARG